jgi:magnesium chelatase family protein
MVSLVSTVAYLGLEARAVVKCSARWRRGCPRSAWSACRTRPWASRERVHSALAALGGLPPKRITINLSRPTCPRRLAL